LSSVIFSLYINIETVSHHESKDLFNGNYDWLLSKQKSYASDHNIEYRHYTYDKSYIEYKKWFQEEYPEISEYNIVNFYKIHLLYKLAEEFDEILYLDFDVIPVTKLNFFEEWDLRKGIAVMSGGGYNRPEVNEVDTMKFKHNVRSPMAKYWNTKVMFIEKGITEKPLVFNTGIIGTTKESLKELDYFKNFRETLNFMSELIEDDFYDGVRYMFGYDNETIWGYKILSQKIKYQNLQDGWHHVMDKWNYIPVNTKFIHCINKNFDYVRGWHEKNNF